MANEPQPVVHPATVAGDFDRDFPNDMIVEAARVLRVSENRLWVQCESQLGCARCAAGEGCGAGLFAGLLRRRPEALAVPFSEGDAFSPGDRVLLGLSATAVRNAAWLLYGLPLAGLLAGAIAFHVLLGPEDLAAFGGALAGLLSGLWLARRLGHGAAVRTRLQLVLLRRLAGDEPCPGGREA